MSKHHQRNKEQSNNRVSSTMSVGPEAPNQIQDQIRSSGSQTDSEFMPSYEDIQARAYQIHEQKGGSDLENWLEAERILKEEHYVQH